MSLSPTQIAIAVFELGLLALGAFLVLRACFHGKTRRSWFINNRLVHWDVSGAEVTMGILTMFVSGLVIQMAARQLLGSLIESSVHREGLEVLVYGAGFQIGVLVGWQLFPSLQRALRPEYGSPPPLKQEPNRLPPAKVGVSAATTVLAALPVLSLASLGWTWLLRAAGLPDAPQDLIDVFDKAGSVAVVAGMLIVACVLAPMAEELLFRRVIYGYMRQRFGRAVALFVSATFFAALHANWAGFVPLALLGVALAIAYEKTGDIRVPVVAHGLFNLNTILIVLSEIPR